MCGYIIIDMFTWRVLVVVTVIWTSHQGTIEYLQIGVRTLAYVVYSWCIGTQAVMKKCIKCDTTYMCAHSHNLGYTPFFFPSFFPFCNFYIPYQTLCLCFFLSSVIMVPGTQWYSARLQAGWWGVWVPAGTGKFSLHHHIQTGSGAHTASYTVGIRGSFPGGKASGSWSWPLLS
jgi:hypothetical protein